jgi:hypothetical protein
MISRTDFINSLAPLREMFNPDSEGLRNAILKAKAHNPWFTVEFIEESIQGITQEFLDPVKCEAWLIRYPERKADPKRVALIMAGNIPLVGFHDLFCVLASGHQAVVKLSEKDDVLIPFLLECWKTVLPAINDAVHLVAKVDKIDAVIATGSNNSLRYFEYYFKPYPHVFRNNRNGVAVLTGSESERELKALGDDIFLYFGLGCRNVSKVLVPKGYDFSAWESAMVNWADLANHNKYRNNLDYNFAIYIINSVKHIQLGHLILKEDEQIASRIGCVHYQYYSNIVEARSLLDARRDEIQCVISSAPIEGWEHIRPGQGQRPALDQYADGVDTMAFLSTI